MKYQIFLHHYYAFSIWRIIKMNNLHIKKIPLVSAHVILIFSSSLTFYISIQK